MACGYLLVSVCRVSDLDPAAMLQELREATDHTIINEYFDAIEKLVALVLEDKGAQAKDEGLCDAVLHLQDVSLSTSDHYPSLLTAIETPAV